MPAPRFMFKTFFVFRELEDLEVLRQEVTRPRAEVEFNKTPLKVTLFYSNFSAR